MSLLLVYRWTNCRFDFCTSFLICEVRFSFSWNSYFNRFALLLSFLWRKVTHWGCHHMLAYTCLTEMTHLTESWETYLDFFFQRQCPSNERDQEAQDNHRQTRFVFLSFSRIFLQEICCKKCYCLISHLFDLLSVKNNKKKVFDLH